LQEAGSKEEKSRMVTTRVEYAGTCEGVGQGGRLIKDEWDQGRAGSRKSRFKEDKVAWRVFMDVTRRVHGRCCWDAATRMSKGKGLLKV